MFLKIIFLERGERKMETEIKHTCTRCRRTRREKFMWQRKNYSGKKVWRCRKKSVCASKGARFRALSVGS